MEDYFFDKDLNRFKLDAYNNKVLNEDLTVVIPVLNEEEGIVKVIKDVKAEGYHNILVVDGYSTDNTVSMATKNGVEVIYQHGIGKTGAIKTAIENVRTPYFIVMDGDCTYDPKDIKNFQTHIKEYDEIIGSRVVGRKNIPLLNRFGNYVINTIFNIIFGVNLIDVCSGMYALNTNFAKTLYLETKGFDVEVEIAAQTVSKGRITQVPINYTKRIGKKKLNPWKDGLQILFTVIKLSKTYNPVFFFSALGALSMIPSLIIFIWVLKEWLQGVWYAEWAFFGTILVSIGLSSIIISTISILMKRMEQRIKRKIK